MPSITHYEPTTGKPISIIKAEGPSLEANKVGDWVDGAANLDTDYIKDGGIAPRPAQSSVLTGTNLTSLPAPCTITVNGTKYDCTEDHAELTFDQPGTYKIVVTAWPYLDKEFTVENPAP